MLLTTQNKKTQSAVTGSHAPRSPHGLGVAELRLSVGTGAATGSRPVDDERAGRCHVRGFGEPATVLVLAPAPAESGE